jgi:hypothetical protein
VTWIEDFILFVWEVICGLEGDELPSEDERGPPEK